MKNTSIALTLTMLPCVLSAEILGIAPAYDRANGLHLYELTIQHDDGTEWTYPVPFEAIGSDWQESMYAFSRANARWFGYTDLALANCPVEGGPRVTWHRQVGDETFAKSSENVVTYFPQFDSRLAITIEPWRCVEKAGTGGLWYCDWDLPQGNWQMGFNYAVHTNEWGSTVQKCWRRDFEHDI